MYEKIKDYYDNKLWSLQRVWNVVNKVITETEYYAITMCVYPAMR